jgi:uncharacterized protein
MLEFAAAVSAKLQISNNQVEAVLRLLSEGATIPFIARYRKDQTGNLDEVQIQAIQDKRNFNRSLPSAGSSLPKQLQSRER